MKFFVALVFWLILAAIIIAGFAMAAHGSPWLLIGSSAVFVALFAKIGCLSH